MRSATASAAASPARPRASLTRACRPAFTGAFQRSTLGSMTQLVWPWGTPPTAPSWWPMPWLAPYSTRPSPKPASQTAIWQSRRAARSSGFSFVRGKASANILSAWMAVASGSGWAEREHRVSTAWSTARTPVESHSQSGVWTVAAGSRITAAGALSRAI